MIVQFVNKRLFGPEQSYHYAADVSFQRDFYEDIADGLQHLFGNLLVTADGETSTHKQIHPRDKNSKTSRLSPIRQKFHDVIRKTVAK